MVPDFENDARISQRHGKKNTNATAVRIRYVMPVSIILPNFHFLLIEMCPPLYRMVILCILSVK